MTDQTYVAFRASLAPYAGHEWRERVPLGSGYICCECGSIVKSAAEMDAEFGKCKPRLAPVSWQPQKAVK